ncbi:hypothetical protein PX699_00445 [Sphingobium sp. H39-3-25]|uniref:hypothetical protein n=1 Tax=Sphingobium arseniciresistens TaxID=3030834 RepID=UPI0023B9C1DB|nr:hypothetical protein [Sphingobium arseniciresistens]
MMVPGVEGSVFWTFEAVEERMIEAWGYMMRLPDAERGWLAAASRSSMPAIVRHNAFGDYFETSTGRPGLRAAQVTMVEAVFTGEGAWIDWVFARDRPLIATVMKVKLRQHGGGFAWADVAQAGGGGVQPDALRMRYNRAITRIAAKANVNL